MERPSERTQQWGDTKRLTIRVPAAGGAGLSAEGPELVRIVCREPRVWLAQFLVSCTGLVAGDAANASAITAVGLGKAMFPGAGVFPLPVDGSQSFNQNFFAAHTISLALGFVGDFVATAGDRDVILTATYGAAPFSSLSPEYPP